MRMQRCLGKHFSNFAEDKVHARAWVSPLKQICRKESPLERGLPRSSELQTYEKVLDARNSRSIGAWPPLERVTQTLARAWIPPLEWTVKHTNFWIYAFHARAWLLPLERKCMYSGFTLERESPRSSVGQMSGKSRLTSKHETRPPTNLNSFFWAKSLENTSKLKV